MVLWAYPSPQPKQYLKRFSHFCRADGKASLYFTMGYSSPLKIAPSHWGSGPTLPNTKLWTAKSLFINTQKNNPHNLHWLPNTNSHCITYKLVAYLEKTSESATHYLPELTAGYLHPEPYVLLKLDRSSGTASNFSSRAFLFTHHELYLYSFALQINY